MKNKKEYVPLIEVEDLKKYYPLKGGIVPHTTGYLKAVDGVGFTIREGETLGLVGESGCGKSTIGRQLVGLEKPTAGVVKYKGRNLEELKGKEGKKSRMKLQMVFQDSYSSLNPRKHIFEILSQPMLYHGLADKTNIQPKLERILDMVGLSKGALGRYPHEFSGGQRQRICIAKALSLNPRFIVCDEPVSALDVSIQAQILNLLRQLQKELNITCLFIGHGLGAVNYVSDRIAVMYLGKIVEIADAGELFRNPIHPYTRALCNAAPIPDPNRSEKKEILLEGEIASEIHPPSGCRFHPRCPQATGICKEREPRMSAVIDEESIIRGGDTIYGCSNIRESSHMAACPIVMSKSSLDERKGRVNG